MTEQDVVLSISTPAARGLVLLKKVCQELCNDEAFKISSIYQVNRKIADTASIRNLRANDWSQKLEVVVWLKSKLAQLQWIEKIKRVESQNSLKSLNQNIKCYLLFYSDETTMTPQITLPYPELHRRSVTMELIAEIWPDKIHPILKKTVYELSQSAKEKELGEFFSTGSQLI
jgi:7,8-dihydro-6-hydroxymethylpterin-pyrophosphokinase